MKERLLVNAKVHARLANRRIIKTFGPGVALSCTCYMLYVHRNVIKASIKGEELPPAPAWHFWAKNRRSA